MVKSTIHELVFTNRPMQMVDYGLTCLHIFASIIDEL